jgi:hypothetical protein
VIFSIIGEHFISDVIGHEHKKTTKRETRLLMIKLYEAQKTNVGCVIYTATSADNARQL